MKKTVSKALIGTVAAGAMAASVATPAAAKDRYKDGPSTGEVIAGAAILGGIVALASAAGKDRDGYSYRDNYRYRDNVRYRGDRWQRRGNPRRATERCIRAAERQARQYGFRYADVTQIRDVDDTRYGWRVKGRIVVDGQRGFRGYRHGYGARDYDRGRFTCYVGRGQRPQVDFSGIRGLR